MNIRSKTTVMVVSALVLVAVGSTLLWREFAAQQLHIPRIPAQASALESARQTLAGKPVQLAIPSLDKTLVVRTGSYDTGSRTWTLDSQHVFWADLSAPANTAQGTTVLYAHAEPQLFGDLPRLKLQDEVRVKTDTGYLLRYKLVGGQEVDPDQSGFMLKRDGAPRLILQTCSGMGWQKRHLFAFDLVGVTKV